MDGFGGEVGFGGIGEARAVSVELLTESHVVTGVVRTRFGRVGDILNQLSGTHLALERATLTPHADPAAATEAPTVLVATSAILVFAAPDLAGSAMPEMRIPKEPVRVELSIPPVHVTGSVHVSIGSRAADGLLNMTDQFLAMTDVTVSSATYPHLARTHAALAVGRARAQIIIVAEDDEPEEVLAEVLDQRTAETWLAADETPA